MNHSMLRSESKSFSSDGTTLSSNGTDDSSPESMCGRPAPLRTVGTYDDDAFFSNVALNMISRYDALSISLSEAICSVLVSPRSRASFLDGLYCRLSRPAQVSPTTHSLAQKTNEIFGQELRRLVEHGSSENPPHYYPKHSECNRGFPPKTPRHVVGPTSSGSSSQKKKKRRSFFPDCDSVLFRSRKVKNIDWKLAEAIEQVQSLRLDNEGQPNSDRNDGAGYRPPQLG